MGNVDLLGRMIEQFLWVKYKGYNEMYFFFCDSECEDFYCSKPTHDDGIMITMVLGANWFEDNLP
jgi:hypothetical protein